MIGIKPEVRPIETVTPIKPSEAIRLGCLLYPVQNHMGQEFDGKSACARGALEAGYGYGPGDDGWGALFTTEWAARKVDCPATPGCHFNDRALTPHGLSISWALAHLNDGFGHEPWSRERIADWLESIGL